MGNYVPIGEVPSSSSTTLGGLAAFAAVVVGVLWLTGTGPFSHRSQVYRQYRHTRKKTGWSRGMSLGFAEAGGRL